MTLATLATDSPIRSLAAEIRRQLDTKRDLMADTRRVSWHDTDANDAEGVGLPGLSIQMDLADGPQAFNLTRYAHGQVAEYIGLPWRRYESLMDKHPDLLAHLSNGLFSREPNKRLLRTVDGQVRAFLSNSYRPRDNFDLMEAILPVFEEHPGEVVFDRCSLTETQMYVKVRIPGFELPITPKVGDVIQGGLIVKNSEVGAGSLGVFPYTTRLSCLNGMVHTEFGQRTRHVGRKFDVEGIEDFRVYSESTLQLDDAAFFAKVADTVRATLNETIFESIAQQMRDLAGIAVEGAPDKVIEVFTKKNGLTETEGGSMLAALIDEGDRSAWGYVNALTRTARDIEDADRQVELQTLAGKLVSSSDWALVSAA